MKRVVLMIGLLAGCSTTAVTTDQPKPPPTSLPASVELKPETPSPVEGSAKADNLPRRNLLQRVSLKRTGGFVGSTVIVDITPAGAYRWENQNGGNSRGSLGELDQQSITKLKAAFEGFDDYRPAYSAKGGTADDYKITITYGDKTVTASDASPELPAKFMELYRLVIASVGVQ